MSTPMDIDQPAGSKAGKAKDTGKKRFEVKKVWFKKKSLVLLFGVFLYFLLNLAVSFTRFSGMPLLYGLGVIISCIQHNSHEYKIIK